MNRFWAFAPFIKKHVLFGYGLWRLFYADIIYLTIPRLFKIILNWYYIDGRFCNMKRGKLY